MRTTKLLNKVLKNKIKLDEKISTAFKEIYSICNDFSETKEQIYFAKIENNCILFEGFFDIKSQKLVY